MLENLKFVEILNTDIVKLDKNLIFVDRECVTYVYEEISGRLFINIDKLPSGKTSVITIRIRKN